jgi:hypothetical protein
VLKVEDEPDIETEPCFILGFELPLNLIESELASKFLRIL